MYFKAPSAAPKIRLTKPKCTISITRVKAEASNRKTSGTSNHIRIKATTWAKVSDVPILRQAFRLQKQIMHGPQAIQLPSYNRG